MVKILTAYIVICLCILNSGLQAEVLLKKNTKIPIKLQKTITSQSVKVNDKVMAYVLKDIYSRKSKQIIISEGTPVQGIITSAKRKGNFGRSGTLGVEFVSVQTVHGDYINLDKNIIIKKRNKRGRAVLMTVAFGPLGILKDGSNAKISKRKKLIVKLSEDYHKP